MKKFISIFLILIMSGLIACGGGGKSSTEDGDTDDETSTESTDGKTIAWTASSNTFSTGRESHSSAVNNDYLYVIGGCDVSGSLGDIQYAKINSDGSLGSFTTSSNTFATERGSHSSVVCNDYLYVIGGLIWETDSLTFLNDIEYAKINTDGSLENFTVNSNSLPSTRYGHKAVVYNNYLYITGGNEDGASVSYLNDVQYAAINADGSIGSFTKSSNTFSGTRAFHSSVAYNGYLYVIGGSDNSNYYSDIQYAAVNADGSLGTFTTNSISLPVKNGNFGSFIYNGYLFIAGGFFIYDDFLGTVEAVNTVYYAKIKDDGSIGSFSKSTSFTTGRLNLSAVVNGNYAYITGGTDYYDYFQDIQIGDLSEF